MKRNKSEAEIKPMKHSRSTWKRWMRLAVLLLLLASVPFIYISCGGEGQAPQQQAPTFGTVVIAGGSVK